MTRKGSEVRVLYGQPESSGRKPWSDESTAAVGTRLSLGVRVFRRDLNRVPATFHHELHASLSDLGPSIAVDEWAFETELIDYSARAVLCLRVEIRRMRHESHDVSQCRFDTG